MSENVHADLHEDDGREPRVDVRQAVESGGRWGVLSSVIEQVLGAAVTAVLARLLVPRELGLVAAATVVIGLFALLTRVGVLPAIVRRAVFDERAAATAFWGAALLGLAGTALAAATAPLTAAALGTPQAAGLVAALSVMILLGMLANVVQGVALRSLRYRVVYGSDVVSAAVYAGVALIGAGPLEMGAWAIVVGRLVSAAARLLALFAGARWWPGLAFDVAVLREDARFNAVVFGSQLTGFASKNVDYWAVGRAFSPGVLGVYYVAYVVPTILRQRLTWLANELLLPALVQVRGDRDEAARVHGEVVRMLAFAAMPALVGMALVAPELVTAAFGSRWSAAAGPMAALALAAAVEVVTQVDTTFFLSIGKARRSLDVNLARLAVLAVLLPLAVLNGGIGLVALAVLASTVAGQAVAQRGVWRDFGISAADVGRHLLPVAVPVAVMAAAVALARLPLADVDSGLRLAALAAVGVAVFGAAALGLYREATIAALRQVRRFVVPTRGPR